MAISDRITSIEEHVKESYQELEGIGIDTTGVNKNLENIPKLIDGYWETLPKVTGEGTSITLDNTKEGKMKINLKGNTSQETTTGKNLFNKESISWGTAEPIIYTTINIPNGTYTMSSPNMPAGTDNICNLFVIPEQASTGASSSINGVDKNTSRTLTITGGKITIANRKTTQMNTNDPYNYDWQLESGSTATSYEPYTNGASPNPDYPQDIHVVSGDNSINVCGKNLFTNIVYKDSYIINSTGGETGNALGCIWDKIEVKPNTTYTLSYSSTDYSFAQRVSEYNSSDTFIQRSITQTSPYTFTTTANTKYINLSGLKTDTNIQIEKNNQATIYEAYKGASYPITLPEGMFLGWIPNTDYRDIIFQAKTGNTYYDSLDSTTKESLTYGKWYVNKQIGKVVLDGSESIGRQESANNTYRFSIGISSTNVYSTDDGGAVNPILSDKFIATNRNGTFARVQGICYGMKTNTQYKNFVIYYGDTSITTREQFANWLTNNNVLVYYVLATPTYTEITDSTLISQLEAINGAKSYNPQTNINQVNNDESSIINATALENV